MLNDFLSTNVSFNIFMFHGGTNFGFTSGAVTALNGTLEQPGYKPELTSYDFSAPLDEAGDPTEKYYLIKRALKNAVNCIYYILLKFMEFVFSSSNNQ